MDASTCIRENGQRHL